MQWNQIRFDWLMSNQTLINIFFLFKSFLLMSPEMIQHEEEDLERYGKRPRLDDSVHKMVIQPFDGSGHPPSHALLGIPLPEATESGAINFLEKNVGISEYVGRESARIQGIIKQRYAGSVLYSSSSLKFP